MPWDIFASQFSKYLRLTYVAATLSGIVIAVELTILALPGNSVDKRRALARAAEELRNADLTTLQLVLLAGLVLLLGYLIGLAAQSLFFLAKSRFTMLAWSIRSLWDFRAIWTGLRKITSRRPPTQDAQEGPYHKLAQEGPYSEAPKPRHPKPRWAKIDSATVNDRHYDLHVRGDRIAYLFSFLRTTRVQPRDIVSSVNYRYGEDTVRALLEKHPIRVSLDKPGSVDTASEYCALWLQRNMPDFQQSSLTNFALVLYNAVIPLFLAPFVIQAVDYHAGILTNPVVSIAVALILIGWFLSAANEIVRRVPFLLFSLFVACALVADNPPAQHSDEASVSPSEQQTT